MESEASLFVSSEIFFITKKNSQNSKHCLEVNSGKANTMR